MTFGKKGLFLHSPYRCLLVLYIIVYALEAAYCSTGSIYITVNAVVNEVAGNFREMHCKTESQFAAACIPDGELFALQVRLAGRPGSVSPDFISVK